MQEAFNRYLDYLRAERNVSPYTVRNYTTDLWGSRRLKGFFPFLKEKGVSSLEGVDRALLRDYLAYLLEQGVVKASLARKLSAVRSFYRYLRREELVSFNPLEGINSPKLDRRLPSFLTMEEVTSLLALPHPPTPQGLRNRAMLELLYAAGMRVSELVKLDLGQVNLASGELLVWGKGSKERIVLMGKPAIQALSDYIAQGRPGLLGKRRNPALFLNPCGGRLTVRMVQEVLAGYSRELGLGGKLHPHTLRHTFATHLLDGGADLRVVQELLGHASLSSTQVYTHITKKQARKVYLAAHPLAQEEKES